MVASQKQLGRFARFKSLYGYPCFTFLRRLCQQNSNSHDVMLKSDKWYGIFYRKNYGKKYRQTELAYVVEKYCFC